MSSKAIFSDSDFNESDWDFADLLMKQLKIEDIDKEENDDCSHEKIILDDGNYICKKCNCVVSRHIDHGAEWRFYGSEQKGADPTRCGLPTSELLPNSSLGSIIGFSNNEKHAIRIMRKYHMWNSMTYKERSLYNIFESISLIAMNNGIPKSIIDEAKSLYKTISESKISRGDNRCGIIASSIYIACKNNNGARSAKEIAKIFNLKVSTMTKGCKRFQDLMKLNIESTQSTDFINRFCSKIDLDSEKNQICREMTKKIDEYGILSENTPPSVAAGTIFICSHVLGWGITKKFLSEKCDISQVTISKCFKKLDIHKEILFKNLL
jgi:transcription initiation factor TFIIB